MKKIKNILFILFIILSMIKPSFINADENTIPIDIYITVSVDGTNATVEMIPWQKQLKNQNYMPGPQLANPTLNISAGSSKDFVVNIKEAGNYVYEIRQINKTDNKIDYDVDISGDDKIYRFYITTIYKVGTNNTELEYFVEAETCDDYSCILNPISQYDVAVPHNNALKPNSIYFENKLKAASVLPTIPITGVTIEDIVVAGGLCSEFLILLLIIFRRKKKVNN